MRKSKVEAMGQYAVFSVNKSQYKGFRLCLVASLRALPKPSSLSETSNRSFLISVFNFVLSLSNAKYLQNLTVLKNVKNSWAARQCNL